VTPAGVVATPSAIDFSQGGSVGLFSFTTDGNLYTLDYNAILFVLNGTDAGLYSLNIPSVAVFVSFGMSSHFFPFFVLC
jgi:hypothetical protein